jgi:hypothetical protein
MQNAVQVDSIISPSHCSEELCNTIGPSQTKRDLRGVSVFEGKADLPDLDADSGS